MKRDDRTANSGEAASEPGAAADSLSYGEGLGKALFETALDAVLIIDRNTLLILDENQAARDLYGYTENDFRAMTPMDLSAEPELTRTAMDAQPDRETVHRLHRKRDGTVFPVEATGTRIDVGGVPFGVITIHDVSTRAALETKSNAAEAKFSAAFRSSPDAVNINRLSDGLYREINRGFTELTGYTPEDVEGRTSLELNIWDDPADRALLVEGLRDRGEVQGLEARFRRKDGSVTIAEMSASIIELDGEKCILSITRDVSKRKELERGLQDSVTMYRAVADFNYDWEVWRGTDDRYIYVSPACERITGYTDDEFMRDPDLFLRIVHEEDRESVREHLKIGDDPPTTIEFRVVNRDGTVHDIEHICQSVHDSDGTWLGRRASNRDISDRKAAERALEHELDVQRSIADLSEVLVAETLSMPAVTDLVLYCARGLTGAEHGYISFIDPTSGDLTLTTLSDMMEDGSCGLAGPDGATVLHASEDGTYPHLWGWSLNTRQSHFENDPASHEAAAGVPDGHILLQNFLAVPANSGSRLVGQIALANKPGGFTADDVATVERLAALYVVAALRDEAQAALLDAQLVLQAAMDYSPVGIAIGSVPDGRLRYINKMGLTIGGGTEDELVNDMDAGDYVAAWHLCELDGTPLQPEESPLERAIRFGEKGSRELILRRGNGEDRYIDSDAAPLLGPNGEILGGITVFVDVTERRAEQLELLESRDQLGRMVYQISEAMGRVVDVRDPYTAGHQKRVTEIATAIAAQMELPEVEVQAIEMASIVHDIGKLGVPAEILTKPGSLSSIEFELIKGHPEYGYEILKGIDFPWPVAEIVLRHHERLDGSGYPGGLTGDAIPIATRVLAVADVVEAMSSHRPYRAALGMEAAVHEVVSHPELYDAAVASACQALFESGRLGS